MLGMDWPCICDICMEDPPEDIKDSLCVPLHERVEILEAQAKDMEDRLIELNAENERLAKREEAFLQAQESLNHFSISREFKR